MLATRSRRPIIYNRGLIAETGVIPPGLQLISDANPFIVQETKKTVVESIVNGKKVNEPVMMVTGLFQECDKQNANARIYGLPIMQCAIRVIQDDVKNRAVMGEFDHPVDAKVHLDRLSHGITKLWMDGAKVYGEAEVMDNQPYGRCLRGLFERKWRVGISSRGVGDMEMREDRGSGKQVYYVLPGYQIVTWDAVAEPSVGGATLRIMEDLRKKTKPIEEARAATVAGRATRTQFLNQGDYENLLLEAINEHFSIRDIGPRRHRR